MKIYTNILCECVQWKINGAERGAINQVLFEMCFFFVILKTHPVVDEVDQTNEVFLRDACMHKFFELLMKKGATFLVRVRLQLNVM